MSISDRRGRSIAGGLACAFAVFVACTSNRGASGDPGVSGGTAGTSGGGEAGMGGGAGTPEGDGGSEAGMGGRASGGSASGGNGGGGSDVGGASGSPGGDGGDAGATSVPEWPSEGDPCSMDGYFACPGPRATYRLGCNGTTWERSNDCGTEQRCNRVTGACQHVLCDPESTMGVCTDSGLSELVCGPDDVTLEPRPCAFQCLEMVGCVEPGNEQVYVDRPGALHVGGNHWPEPLIPVCLVNPADWSPEELATVRDAFYRTWGRYAAIGLTEFGPCNPSSEGVTLASAEACDLELAQVRRTGYPGPGATSPITLCKSYRDFAGITRPVGPELLAHAAVHVFGHVLGRPDAPYSATSSSVMAQAIDLPRLGAFRFQETFVDSTQRAYGMTLPGSLTGPDGRCLSFAGASDEPSRETCTGSPERSFRGVEGRFQHAATGECLRITDGDRVGLGDCAGAEPWEARRVTWLSQGRYCVGVRQPVDAQRPLIREACTAARAADQAWSFEFPASGRARIRVFREGPNGRCVRWPDDWGVRVTPLLGDCDDAHALFETSGGVLAAGGRCLSFTGSTDLVFSACYGGSGQRFGLSGPLERLNELEEYEALTLVPNAGGVELRTTPLVGTPSEAQLFDYYF